MLHTAVVLFVVSIVATLLGFGGIAAGVGGMAKILFVLFALVSVAAFVRGLRRGPSPAVRTARSESPVRQPT